MVQCPAVQAQVPRFRSTAPTDKSSMVVLVCDSSRKRERVEMGNPLERQSQSKRSISAGRTERDWWSRIEEDRHARRGTDMCAHYTHVYPNKREAN